MEFFLPQRLDSRSDFADFIEATGESRFLIQRLTLDVQCGNAAAVLGTIPSARDWSEVGILP